MEPYLRVVRQKYDRQITLKPLLLVDCELNLLFHQRLDNHGRNVEDANFDFAYFLGLIECLQGRFGDNRAQARLIHPELGYFFRYSRSPHPDTL